MSDSYYLACSECQAYVWVGQSQNSNPPFCFYSGEPERMERLKQFLWKHQGHHLVMDESQRLEYEGYLLAEADGKLRNEE